MPVIDVAGMNRLLDEAVPFSRAVGAYVVMIEAERAEALLPASPERLNHVGTVHAVAQFGVGEVAAGALILRAFGELQARGLVPVVAETTLRYKRPANGELRSIAELPLAEQERIRGLVASDGKARFTIPVRIVDGTGSVVTELEIKWALITLGAS
jgi:acyl-coenzyme A thioesterase PaaI-like protein